MRHSPRQKTNPNFGCAMLIYVAAIGIAVLKTKGWQIPFSGNQGSVVEFAGIVSFFLTWLIQAFVCASIRFSHLVKNQNDMFDYTKIQYEPFSFKSALWTLISTPLVYAAAYLFGYPICLFIKYVLLLICLVGGAIGALFMAPFS